MSVIRLLAQISFDTIIFVFLKDRQVIVLYQLIHSSVFEFLIFEIKNYIFYYLIFNSILCVTF